MQNISTIRKEMLCIVSVQDQNANSLCFILWHHLNFTVITMAKFTSIERRGFAIRFTKLLDLKTNKYCMSLEASSSYGRPRVWILAPSGCRSDSSMFILLAVAVSSKFLQVGLGMYLTDEIVGADDTSEQAIPMGLGCFL